MISPIRVWAALSSLSEDSTALAPLLVRSPLMSLRSPARSSGREAWGAGAGAGSPRDWRSREMTAQAWARFISLPPLKEPSDMPFRVPEATQAATAPR